MPSCEFPAKRMTALRRVFLESDDDGAEAVAVDISEVGWKRTKRPFLAGLTGAVHLPMRGFYALVMPPGLMERYLAHHDGAMLCQKSDRLNYPTLNHPTKTEASHRVSSHERWEGFGRFDFG